MGLGGYAMARFDVKLHNTAKNPFPRNQPNCISMRWSPPYFLQHISLPETQSVRARICEVSVLADTLAVNDCKTYLRSLVNTMPTESTLPLIHHNFC